MTCACGHTPTWWLPHCPSHQTNQGSHVFFSLSSVLSSLLLLLFSGRRKKNNHEKTTLHTENSGRRRKTCWVFRGGFMQSSHFPFQEGDVRCAIVRLCKFCVACLLLDLGRHGLACDACNEVVGGQLGHDGAALHCCTANVRQDHCRHTKNARQK